VSTPLMGQLNGVLKKPGANATREELIKAELE